MSDTPKVSAATQSGINDMAAYAADTMAFQKAQAQMNMMTGITSGIANMAEALGQAFTKRGEAAKQEIA